MFIRCLVATVSVPPTSLEHGDLIISCLQLQGHLLPQTGHGTEGRGLSIFRQMEEQKNVPSVSYCILKTLRVGGVIE